MAKLVTKKDDRRESYNEKKLYSSVYSSALNAHYTHKQAENLADSVFAEIHEMVHDRTHLSSKEIGRMIMKVLKEKDHEVAFLYESHKDTC